MNERFERARSVLSQCERLVDGVWSYLRSQCAKDGRVSGKKLDEHQLASYDAAFSAAELAAAHAGLDYADKVAAAKGEDGAAYERALALVFCAEAVANLRGRLGARPGDYGLGHGDVAAVVDSAEARALAESEGSSANLARVGDMVAAREGSSGVSMLDERCEMMRDTFRQVANDVVAPLAEEVHRHDLLIPDAILSQIKELGCFGLSIPERYGGLQDDDAEDSLGMIVVTEELSRGSLGAAGSLITRPEILARALLAGGTEAQKKHWLPKLAAGEPLCAVAVTEPDYGSDVAAMKLKAEKVEGGYKLDGAKTWCTFGGKAGVYLVLARTNPDPSLGHKGLSVFMVEKPSFDGHDFEYTQPEAEGGGTISGRAIATIGYRGMHSYETFFDNYFVPDENLLGGPDGEGKGFYYIMAGFAGGRIQTAGRAIGVMQAAFEAAVTYAGERKVFGHPIADYQLTKVKLARMAANLCACRQFTYAVGELMDKGEAKIEPSLVKLFTCRVAEWLTREAMQIHGGMGYAEETAVSRYFVDARVLSIFEGAEETLALKVVARSLIEGAKA
ncbi:MAG: acyl-CoA dehydrogenase family protein [Myxococcales bacterium]|nr:acyl-CoA dehydrogenase family protein [Myxococcales bacterium]